MTNRCLNPGSCPCAQRSPIDASNNAIGPAIINWVPAVALAAPSDPSLNFRYVAANNNDGPLGLMFRRSVAEVEHVNAACVCATGSLLELFGRLPRDLGRRNIVKVEGDFVGYGRGAARDLPLTEVKVQIGATSVDPDEIAQVVRGKDDAIVFLTYPVTNPLQQTMPIDAIEAVLSSNKSAIVVADNAYGGFGEIKNLASIALSNDRTIYVQTASKDLFLCGVRVGWAIASPPLLAPIAASMPPYALSPASLDQVSRLIHMPEVVRAMRQQQASARDILAEGLRALGLSIRGGVGPWVLVNLGIAANRIVNELAKNHRITVQAQLGSLTGWVRISATVPCQAETIVAALTSLLCREAA
jgi:histidinol-phosphate/aromatic aminotransferase/cobyric acid decarboxylase-like protein